MLPEFREERQLAGLNARSQSCLTPGHGEVRGIVGHMARPTRGDEVPLFVVAGVAVQVHRREPNWAHGARIEERIAGHHTIGTGSRHARVYAG